MPKNTFAVVFLLWNIYKIELKIKLLKKDKQNHFTNFIALNVYLKI